MHEVATGTALGIGASGAATGLATEPPQPCQPPVPED
jgi:hypothetical protein